jgi:HAMP domain-containing protein
LSGVILLFMLVVSIFVARSVTAPLQHMTGTMNDLASGNLAVEVPGIGRGDEIGEMAKAVEVFKSNAVARQSLEAEQRAAETRAVASRKADMNKMADDFEAAVGRIVEDGIVRVRPTRGLGGHAHRDRGAARRNSRRRSRRPPRKLPPTSNRWPPPPRRWPRPSPRSAARCRNRRGWPSDAVDQARFTNEPRQRIVEGGNPHRRRRRTDQHHRGPDQSACAQRHHRGSARR